MVRQVEWWLWLSVMTEPQNLGQVGSAHCQTRTPYGQTCVDRYVQSRAGNGVMARTLAVLH